MAAPVWSDYGGNLPFYDPSEIAKFQLLASQGNKQFIALRDDIVSKVGNLDTYLAKQKEYLAAKKAYDDETFGKNITTDITTKNLTSSATKAQEDLKAQQKAVEEARTDRYNTIRNELETQYNNLVSFDPRLAYQGRAGDLPTVFNQQAAQLADAGVTSIANLKVQDGTLIDSATGNTVSTSNLGGQVAVDRDTGVQKWGDIFSGVKGGANYGIQALEDGSVVLFPAWEKTKSPIAQIGLGSLEKYITPILTVGGALLAGPVGGSAVAGAAAGAAGGSTAGQLLASGKVDWEQVAKSAATAGAGQYVSGLLTGGEAAAAGEAAGTATGTGISGGGLTSAEMAALKGADAYGGVASGATVIPVAPPIIGESILPGLGDTTGGLLGPDLGFQIASDTTVGGMTGADYGFQIGARPDLLAQDLDFLAEQTAQLYQAAGGDLNAVQQNLIASGVDPIVAAEAANQASLTMGNAAFYDVSGALPVLIDPAGQLQAGIQGISSSVGAAFPNAPIFTSEGLLSGGSTMDQFAKDIGGNITSTAGAGLGTAGDLLKAGASLVGKQPQPQPYQSGYGAGRQMAGVDASGLLALLQGRAGVPGVAGLLAPVVNPYSLLG